MSAMWEDLKSRLGTDLLETIEDKGLRWAVLRRESLIKAASYLKNEKGFVVLMDLTCVDYREWSEKPHRFEVIYNFLNPTDGSRVFFKVPVKEEDATVPSLARLFAAADWYEREVWDMFGVKFSDHPGLKRILMYEEFEGHPLRKDYPYGKRQPLIGPKN